MKIIDWRNINGVRIQIDNEDYKELRTSRKQHDTSNYIISFNYLDDIDDLIKDLKEYKRKFVEIKENNNNTYTKASISFI